MRARVRARWRLLLYAAIIGAGVWFVVHPPLAGTVVPGADPTPSPSSVATVAGGPEVSGTVAWITDGDTLEIDVEGARVVVRLMNIDAPELAHDGQPAQCLAEEARTALATLAPIGGEVRVVEYGHDRFGRTLGAVYGPDGALVNAELVRQGLAAPFVVGSDVRLLAAVRPAQGEARTAAVGLFAPSGCTMPGRIADLETQVAQLPSQAADRAEASVLLERARGLSPLIDGYLGDLAGTVRYVPVDGLPPDLREELRRRAETIRDAVAVRLDTYAAQAG